jgi:hypothetical protein
MHVPFSKEFCSSAFQRSDVKRVAMETIQRLCLLAGVDRPVRETERKHGQERKFCVTNQAHAMALLYDHIGNCGVYGNSVLSIINYVCSAFRWKHI